MPVSWPVAEGVEGARRLARERDLLAFLPAAIEVEATPPRRAARVIALAVMVFLLLGFAWACVGELDVVAVAHGRVVPSGRVKVVQPLEAGVVERILVAEGQRVRRGQPLVVLDATASAAERKALGLERERLWLARARLVAQLEALRRAGGGPPREVMALAPFAAPADPALRRQAARQGERALAELAASLEALAQEAGAKAAERAVVAARLAQLEATLPLLAERADAARAMADRGHGARADWLVLEEERVRQRQAIEVLEREQSVLTALVAATQARARALAAGTEQAWLAELEAVDGRLAALGQSLDKARRAEALRTLVAPVDGAVQQLAVHTEGGVVTPAQPLLVVVPEEEAVRLEVVVANQDIGFVHAGQRATVKVHTFPYTRYGTLEGRVAAVSADAVPDAQGVAHYLAQVEVARASLEVDGRRLALRPGMAVTVEVLTGRRPVIDYLFSPLARRLAESARER